MFKPLYETVKSRPEDPEAHFLLGQKYARHRRWLPAIAEYRTSIALGKTGADVLVMLAGAYLRAGLVELAGKVSGEVLAGSDEKAGKAARKILQQARTARPEPLESTSQLQYTRLRRLADHIRNLHGGPCVSVLDVGGGEGRLCLFMPEARYVLAEPSINGISGEALPFAEKHFDVVVSCHVLEHVPPAGRRAFLDALCSRAKYHLLLLNPFYEEGGDSADRTRLVFDLTGYNWAKEHLECGLPGLDELRAYAQERGCGLRIFPNGSKHLALAYVFLEHYAAKAGGLDELKKVNSFFNTFYHDKLTNEKHPNDYLVEISLGHGS
jgi:SAM-dependent methyltransferase